MTAIAALFNRTGEPVDGSTFDSILSTMRHRGSDGVVAHCAGNVGLGAQLFWTTPEDVGVRQPLSIDGSPCWILFDGRIDNRIELMHNLRIHGRDGAGTSDAELALRAYVVWDDRFVERLLGSFGCVIVDPVHQSVLCCRDALGARTLYYYLSDRFLVVASEEQAVLAHPAVKRDFDELSMARYFTIREPSPGHTFFQDVAELLPATCMRVSRDSKTVWRYWEPHVTRVRYRSDDEYAEHLRDLLTESVRCRMRSQSPPAVQMSGGLDSTSVAATAATLLAASPQPQRLNTISYVFKELSVVDESVRIDAMAANLGLSSLRFNGDECWPRNRHETWPRNPNRPDINLYRLLAQPCYRITRGVGARVLLTGAESDNLFTGNTEWLFELLRDGKLVTAAMEFLRFASPFHRRQAEPLFFYLSLRRLAGRALDVVRRPDKQIAYTHEEYPWLSDHALNVLNESVGGTERSASARTLQFQGIFTSGSKWLIAAERYFASLEGVEIRRPYFDRRLVEFMLAIPSYQLYKRGYMKYILREAMRNRLPQSVRGQIQRTVYTPLFQVGMVRDRERLRSVTANHGAFWTKYLRREWLKAELPNHLAITRKTRRGYLVGDWCIAVDAWADHLNKVGLLEPNTRK